LNMPTMMNIAKGRVMKYIGKVVREEKAKTLHTSFLTTYCHSPRHVGDNKSRTIAGYPYKCTIENMDP
jgi:hypothetical protein